MPGDTWDALLRKQYFGDSLSKLIKSCPRSSSSIAKCLFLDIGAHFGVYAMIASQHGNYDAIGYEAQPDLSCVSRISRTVNEYSQDKLQLRHCYVAGEEQTNQNSIEICAAMHSRGASRLKSVKREIVFVICFFIFSCR